MEREEIKSLRRDLWRFCQKFDGCIKDPRTHKHLRTYVKGQLSDLPRKSVEPMALEAGTPVRTLQEFLSIHRWDHEAAARCLRKIVQKKHGNPNAIGVIDETSFQKKGEKTAGVQRQWCGSTGKVDNCVVSVHLGYVSGDFHTFLDGDLFLPEESWAADRERREEAGIPEEVVYRPKWRIGLDLLKRTLSDGVRMKWLTADEAYGRAMEFRDGVEDLGLLYVVEIPSNLVGWTKRPKIDPAGDPTGIGDMNRESTVWARTRRRRVRSPSCGNGAVPSWRNGGSKTRRKVLRSGKCAKRISTQLWENTRERCCVW